jgi:hypothetical protein
MSKFNPFVFCSEFGLLILLSHGKEQKISTFHSIKNTVQLAKSKGEIQNSVLEKNLLKLQNLIFYPRF